MIILLYQSVVFLSQIFQTDLKQLLHKTTIFRFITITYNTQGQIIKSFPIFSIKYIFVLHFSFSSRYTIETCF